MTVSSCVLLECFKILEHIREKAILEKSWKAFYAWDAADLYMNLMKRLVVSVYDRVHSIS